jgi:hypothetical protein
MLLGGGLDLASKQVVDGFPPLDQSCPAVIH